jgi:hypothetical protein
VKTFARAMTWALIVLALVLPCSSSSALAAPAASHSQQGGVGPGECGDLVYDSVGLMTKGRTDGMVVSASYSQGCQSYRLRTLVGTGLSESYGYPGQQSNCEYFGRQDVVNTFRFYFDTEIDPAQVKVSCSRYSGPD